MGLPQLTAAETSFLSASLPRCSVESLAKQFKLPDTEPGEKLSKKCDCAVQLSPNDSVLPIPSWFTHVPSKAALLLSAIGLLLAVAPCPLLYFSPLPSLLYLSLCLSHTHAYIYIHPYTERHTTRYALRIPRSRSRSKRRYQRYHWSQKRSVIPP